MIIYIIASWNLTRPPPPLTARVFCLLLRSIDKLFLFTQIKPNSHEVSFVNLKLSEDIRNSKSTDQKKEKYIDLIQARKFLISAS